MQYLGKTKNYLASIGIKTTKETLSDYLEYMNDAYIIFQVKEFSESLRKMGQSVSKIYVVDTGLFRVYDRKFKENFSKIMENVVFLHLRRKGLKESENIFYYAWDDKEIDFLIYDGEVRQLIQVSYKIIPLYKFLLEY